MNPKAAIYFMLTLFVLGLSSFFQNDEMENSAEVQKEENSLVKQSENENEIYRLTVK